MVIPEVLQLIPWSYRSHPGNVFLVMTTERDQTRKPQKMKMKKAQNQRPLTGLYYQP